MFRNYILVSLRNIRKNGVYSLLNIAGLAIGIASAILIFVWVHHETTYEDIIPKRDRLYQVWLNAEFDGKTNSWRSVPLPSYEAMKSANVHIINSVVTGWGSSHLLVSGDERIIKKGLFVSEEFLDMFGFPLLYGDPSSVLDNPRSIVMTESAARAFFGDDDPMGNMVRIDNGEEVEVTGILADLPSNTSFDFEYLLTWKFREEISEWIRDNKDNWGNNSFQVYVELDDPAQFATADEAVKPILRENGQEDLNKRFFLYPMERWHLYSDFEDGIERGGLANRVKLFSAIAVFILLIACINFMNMATARSEKRSKEVGIRKTVGSGRRELILQFLGESLMITLFAFLFAVLIAQLALPFYNDLLDKQLTIRYSHPGFWTAGMGMVLITGFLAGSYPALYLSSFQPVSVLKGSAQTGRRGRNPRKILVTLQFVISVVMIIGTALIYQQIQLVKDRELGYDQDRLLIMDITTEISRNYDALKTELLGSGSVEAVTSSNSSITDINSNNFLGWPGKPEELNVLFTTIATRYDYTKTFGIKILEGRDFSPEFASDSMAIIINKSAAELMDLEDPIGTELDLWGSKRKLIGIIDDVLMGSLFREVKPLFMILDPSWAGTMSLRIPGEGDLSNHLATIKRIVDKHNAPYPFEYQFADDRFNKKFNTINQTSQLASIFAFLTIFVTGMGLLGLASYTAEQRIREIGIRKVMGASVLSIVGLISRGFLGIIALALLIACPLGYYLMDVYLEQYPIRVNIGAGVFVMTTLLTLFFALSVIAGQAYRSARLSPVKTIRANS